MKTLIFFFRSFFFFCISDFDGVNSQGFAYWSTISVSLSFQWIIMTQLTSIGYRDVQFEPTIQQMYIFY